MSESIRVALIGAKGRMGQTILALAKSDPKIEIVAECDLGDSIDGAVSSSNVIIDFSQADSIDDVCRTAEKRRVALVIGTTGHSTAQKKTIAATAKVVPVVLASNFSVGVNVLFALARQTVELLGNDFDVRIVETHHKMKKDAPSGTAKTLAEILKTAGKSGAEIPIESTREGEVVGDHTVFFNGPGEGLELTHRASSREIFARGALRAAEWVVGKSPDLYSMQDVLGL
ncbi:MAG TPA: dihydrodipicolinate reductase C-terminal domain-containing protein [Chthoniobacterales bacterium]|nr:dihydrodipicolinate reductase C-terminal domain-containing protein [Chthoniobacterales bacterium]